MHFDFLMMLLEKGKTYATAVNLVAVSFVITATATAAATPTNSDR